MDQRTDSRLSSGVLRQIMIDGLKVPTFTVQMLQSKVSAKPNSKKKYRIAVSDGVNYVTAILNSIFNSKIENKELVDLSLIKVTRYSVNPAEGKPPILIILGIEITDNTLTSQIGAPDRLFVSSTQNSQAPNDSAINRPAMPVTPPPVPPVHAQPEPYHQPAPVYQPPQPAYQPPPAYNPPPPPAYNPPPPPVYNPPPPPPPVNNSISTAPRTAPQASRSGSFLPMNFNTEPSYIPVANLTSYITSYHILVRVVKRTPLRTITSQNRVEPLKILNLILQDKDNDQIQAVAFASAAERIDEIVKLNSVYDVSGGRIRIVNNKRFNLTKHEYEITLDDGTQFIEKQDDGTIGFLQYNYIPIDQIKDRPANSNVDVIGIICDVESARTFMSNKSHVERTKRRIVICDSSNARIELNFWGKDADDFGDNHANEVISIKDAGISNFNGVGLNFNNSSTYTLSPQSPEATALTNWWFAAGQQSVDTMANLSAGGYDGGQELYLSQVNERGLGMSREKGDFFWIYGLITMIGTRKLFYLACPNPDCKFKSVSQTVPGQYQCNACHQMVDVPVPRFTLSLTVADFSGSINVSLVGDDTLGQVITGKTAKEWQEAAPDNGELPGTPFRDYQFRFYHMKLRARADDYGGVLRPKVQVQSAVRLNFAEATKLFAAEIRKFN